MCIFLYIYKIDSEPNQPDPENSLASAKSETEELRWVTQHTFVQSRKTTEVHPGQSLLCVLFFLSLTFSLSHSCLSSGPIASQVDWWRVPCPWQHLPIKLSSLVRLGLRRWVWWAFQQVELLLTPHRILMITDAEKSLLSSIKRKYKYYDCIFHYFHI